MPLGLEFATIYVYDIGKGLEGIEGNSDGEDDIEGETIDMQREKVQKIGGAFNEEIEIFEEDE